VIDRITLEVCLGSRDIEGRCGALGHRHPAEAPDANFSRKSAIVWVFGDDIEHPPEPFDPGFQLIARAKRTRGKTVRHHARLRGQ
jgi:hypothetical protein